MGIKELIFLVITIAVIAFGAPFAARSEKVRHYVLFALVLGTTCPDRFDCNYFGRDWYRGTSRGMQISFIDWLICILFFAIQICAKQAAAGSAAKKSLSAGGDAAGEQKRFWPAGFLPMALYSGYCLLTVLCQNPLLFGVWELTKILRALLAYYTTANIVRGAAEVRVIVNALCTAMIYEGLTAIKQRYGDGMDRVCGSFDHANSLSIYSIMAALLLLTVAFSSEKKPRPLLYGAAALCSVVAVLLTQSRTGFVTILGGSVLVMAACGLFKPTVRNFVTLLLILAIGGGIVGRSWKTIKNRMADNASEISKDKTEGRQYYFNLAKLMLADKPQGVGLNLWSWYATNTYGGRLGMEYNRYRSTEAPPDPEIPYGSQDLAQAAPGHSVVALTLGELGYPGAILFAVVWLRWFLIAGVGLTRRGEVDILSRAHLGVFFALLGCFNQSQTEWAFRQASPFFLAHILLGMCAALLHIREREKRLSGRLPVDAPGLAQTEFHSREITPRLMQ